MGICFFGTIVLIGFGRAVLNTNGFFIEKQHHSSYVGSLHASTIRRASSALWYVPTSTFTPCNTL